MAIDNTKIQKVKTAMDNRYENKQSNKKTNISGDYSGDTNSYPTVDAVKTYIDNQGFITQHQDISGKEDKTNKVTSWSATTSDSRYPSEKLVKTSLDSKVDSSSISDVVRTSNTTGLIKNDGSIDTNTYITSASISGKEDKDNKVTSWSSTVSNSKYPSEKLVKDSLDDKANINSLASVATSGDYDDLGNKPSIPTKTSDLTNDGDGTHAFLTQHQSLSNYVTTTDSRLSDARTPLSHTHGNVSNDGKIGSASGKIVTTGTGGLLQASDSITKSLISDFPSSMTPTAHNQASSTITDANTYTHIGNVTTTQESINSAIDTKLGSLLNIELITVVAELPVASENTMNKMYLVAESEGEVEDAYEIYITVRTGTSPNYEYDWERVDTARIDLSDYAKKNELSTVATSGSYSDLSNKPVFTQDSSITPSTTGRYAIGTINISGSSTTIYGVDSGTSTLDIDAEINQALDDLAEAIYPTPSNS